MTRFRFQNIPEKNHSFGLTKDITESQAHRVLQLTQHFKKIFMKKTITEGRGSERQWIDEKGSRETGWSEELQEQQTVDWDRGVLPWAADVESHD